MKAKWVGLLLAMGYALFAWAVYAMATGERMLPQLSSFGAWVDRPAAVEQGELPKVESERHMKQLLMKYTQLEQRRSGNTKDIAVTTTASKAESAAAPASAGGAADHSHTNVQVQGVDEGDVVKTDGRYIYQVNRQRIVIAEAYPAEQMRIVATIGFASGSFRPAELYIDGDTLTVVGHEHYGLRDYVNPAPAISAKSEAPHPYYSGSGTRVKAAVYSLTDITKPRLLKEAVMDGRYVSSRKIGPALYLIANKAIDPGKPERPTFDDSLLREPMSVDWKEIRYLPDAVEPNYVMIGALRTDRPSEPMQVSAYVGTGHNLYASTEHLYIAAATSGDATKLFQFALDRGAAHYKGTATVNGRVLNQFSMDEHEGYLRIATTSGDMWKSGDQTSQNNIYVLNSMLQPAGKLEGIAPGERIYSARFMGERAYMVTFRTVDPLFVIDLKKPQSPEILGYLKIPGYSDYLHPYDDKHIIGFGKDTVEHKGTALYQGIKIAMFDVSDVSKPVEKHKEMIGDRGTESELLRNHRALLFSREKQLMAFPVTVMEVQPGPDGKKNEQQHGHFTFQGAYVYRVNETDGFTLRGTITHMNEDQYKKTGDRFQQPASAVQRILYIGNTLYTLSPQTIAAHRLDSLEDVKRLHIP